MPELPDLVHVEAGLRAAVMGKRIAAARTGDPTVLRVMVSEPFPAVLVGRTLEGVERRGHFMRFGLDGGLVLVVNAMLVGRYRLVAPGRETRNVNRKDPRALGLALAFDDAPELQYLDDKRMGKVYVARAADEGTIPIYGQLGIDVLSPAFTRDAFGKLVARRRDQVRAFLMDKRTLASIGNAYADEILFAAGLHPKTFCNKLAPADIDALHAAIGRVLTDAIAEIRKRDEPIDDQGPRLPQGARARRQAVCGLRHDDPRGARRRRRRLLLPALSARDTQAVRQLDAPQRWSGGGCPCASAYRKIAPAVATLSESAPADIGMVTRWSQQARAAADSPGPSAPSNNAKRAGGRKLGQRRRARLDDGADDRHPVTAQRLEIAGPRARADDGQAEHRPERDADRLAVERIGAARGEDQRVRAERGGVARQRPQVVDVGEVLGHDQRARAARQRRRTGALADRETAAVDVKAGDGVEHRLRREEHRERAGQRVGQRRQARRGQQHRVHAETARDQPPHDPLALGHEPAPFGVQVALLEPAVVGEPRIVRIAYLDRRQAHARRMITTTGSPGGRVRRNHT